MYVQYRKLVGGGVDGLTHLTSEHSVLCICPTSDELIFLHEEVITEDATQRLQTLLLSPVRGETWGALWGSISDTLSCNVSNSDQNLLLKLC